MNITPEIFREMQACIMSRLDIDSTERSELLTLLDSKYINIVAGQFYLNQSTGDKMMLILCDGDWYLFFVTGPEIGTCCMGPRLKQNMTKEIKIQNFILTTL